MGLYKSTTPRRTSARRTFKYSSPRGPPTVIRRPMVWKAASARLYPYPRIAPPSKNRFGYIGYPPGTGTDYRRITVDKWADAVANKVSKTLHSDELTLIPRKGAVVGEETIINGRERDMIHLLGFTCRFTFRNNNNNTAACVRMALVSPTDKNSISIVEFLRGYDNKRGQSFTSTLDAAELLYNPINRDNHVVLWEKKITLGPYLDNSVGGTTFSRTRDNYTTFQTYVKVDRQLRYEGEDADSCTDKLFLVYWYDEPNGEGSATGTSYVRCQRWVSAHWKDPK